jgi:hypothetical protein
VQYAIVAAFALHAVHLAEHVAQLAYWFAHPSDAPWMTPWAIATRDLLVVGGRIVTGVELLHLIGNALFFGALVALTWLARAHMIPVGRYPHLSKALSAQGVLVAEHALLTLTVFVIGTPLGVSTLFGFATGGWGSSYGIWFDFVLIAISTFYAAMALAEMHQDDLVIPRSTERGPAISATS